MKTLGSIRSESVNCRVGSLEISENAIRTIFFVNCRVGSLEINQPEVRNNRRVNCRVGSLEIHYLR